MSIFCDLMPCVHTSNILRKDCFICNFALSQYRDIQKMYVSAMKSCERISHILDVISETEFWSDVERRVIMDSLYKGFDVFTRVVSYFDVCSAIVLDIIFDAEFSDLQFRELYEIYVRLMNDSYLISTYLNDGELAICCRAA